VLIAEPALAPKSQTKRSRAAVPGSASKTSRVPTTKNSSATTPVYRSTYRSRAPSAPFAYPVHSYTFRRTTAHVNELSTKIVQTASDADEKIVVPANWHSYVNDKNHSSGLGGYIGSGASKFAFEVCF
jgi:hypothetical protein